MTHPPQTKEWEKEFNKEFGIAPYDFSHWWSREDTSPRDIIKFIKDLLSSQKKDLRDKVKGMKRESIETEPTWVDYKIAGYNQALADILEILKHK
jgi:hypothetical protein